MDADYLLINRDDLPFDGSTYEFQGYLHGDTDASFIWVDMPPGENVRLHTHPYKEVFIVLEGKATYIVGSATLEARAGQILVAPADVPHGFTNSGDVPLKQIDIHFSKRFVTHWLE